MSALGDFLASLKEDLLDRRLLPLLLVLVLALVAAVAYAVLGGGSATTGAATASVPSAAPTGVPVSQAPAEPDRSVAETTDGAAKQHHGYARDPFAPLPGAKAAASSTKSTGGAKASGSTPTTPAPNAGTSPSSAGGTTPTTPPAPAKPKVYIHYHVTVQFGVVPPVAEGASPPQPAQLKTYSDIALDEPFPSKANPQLVYLGVVLKTGKDAAFALTGEAILHGSATCKPSATQCQAIELQVGQAETLEVLEGNGSTVTYELKLVSIAKSLSDSASAARAHDALRAEAKSARELRRHAPSLSELHYSAVQGGLVLAGHPAFAARAHAARRHQR